MITCPTEIGANATETPINIAENTNPIEWGVTLSTLRTVIELGAVQAVLNIALDTLVSHLSIILWAATSVVV